MSGKFIYLLQGQAHLVRNYLHLRDAGHRDVIFLVYDVPLEGAVFFPGSTWAEGRNKLCELAREKGNYRYYIFCDDDIEFTRGGWEDFEKALLRFRPSIGVPVVPKTRNGPFVDRKQQPFFVNDEQLIAFHMDVIKDNLLLPYVTRFDAIHYWASCHIQELLIQNFYTRFSLQFNEIQIENRVSTRYPTSEERVNRCIREMYAWLASEFAGDYRDISKNIENHRKALDERIARNRRLYWLNRLCLLSHSARRGEVLRMLSDDSEIRHRYLGRR